MIIYKVKAYGTGWTVIYHPTSEGIPLRVIIEDPAYVVEGPQEEIDEIIEMQEGIEWPPPFTQTIDFHILDFGKDEVHVE